MREITIKNVDEIAEAIGAQLMARLGTDLPPDLLASVLQEPEYLDRGITESEAAKFLGFEPTTLQTWRIRGGGPLFIRPSRRCVRYRRRDLIAWQMARRVASTAENPGAAAA